MRERTPVQDFFSFLFVCVHNVEMIDSLCHARMTSECHAANTDSQYSGAVLIRIAREFIIVHEGSVYGASEKTTGIFRVFPAKTTPGWGWVFVFWGVFFLGGSVSGALHHVKSTLLQN